jgi:hypothetical protein
MTLRKIVSGGQTGADRAALTTARSFGVPITLQVAEELQKPVLHLDLECISTEAAVTAGLSWVRFHAIACLNVAGPRASEDARVHTSTLAIVSGVLTRQGESID